MQIAPPENTWNAVLKDDFKASYFQAITQQISQEIEQGVIIYPPVDMLFQAFEITPFDQVKVVILGQDPYHGEGQAHGLCFSVPKGQKLPPSLRNIYRELQNCYPAYQMPAHGCLQGWAQQGVFLLNSILTVRANEAASHAKIGWERFTDNVIETLSKKRTNLVFILWGAYAKTKAPLIDEKKHLVLTAGHPSFAASHKQFFGNSHFLQCNAYLAAHGKEEIDWQID